MYTIILSSQYKKSLKRISRHKRHKDFDRLKLETPVHLLNRGNSLDRKYRNHELKGEFAGVRECHIQNDILLLYRKENDILVLVLVDIGTHASLFE